MYMEGCTAAEYQIDDDLQPVTSKQKNEMILTAKTTYLIESMTLSIQG